MQQMVLIIHMLICFAIIGLVLLQQGKGSDIGAAFGSGASNTVFGSQGSSSFLLKLTGIIAFCFFAKSMVLTYFSSKDAKQAQQLNLPAQQEQSWLPQMPVAATKDESGSAGNLNKKSSEKKISDD